jgi:hypothetical protein
MLPVVTLIRQLSAPQFGTYEELVGELKRSGFESVPLNIPSRKGSVQFKNNAVFKKDDMVVQVSDSIGVEAGQRRAVYSISFMDKTADTQRVVEEISAWLGAEPNYPARDAQFQILESGAGWTPMSDAEALKWNSDPVGSLAHINVGSMGTGTLVMRIVERAA